MAHVRLVGAVAGLVPAGAIVLLFAASGSLAPTAEVATPLVLVGLVSIMAGSAAGSFAVEHGWFAGACGYGIAWIAVANALAVVQAASEATSANGFDLAAVGVAMTERAAYALISALYFIVPAMALGAVWVTVFRTLIDALSSGRPDPAS